MQSTTRPDEKRQIKDITKISLAEFFNNENGKTSRTGVVGVFLVVVGSFLLVWCTVRNQSNGMMDATWVITTGAGLCGANKLLNTRKYMSNGNKTNEGKAGA